MTSTVAAIITVLFFASNVFGQFFRVDRSFAPEIDGPVLATALQPDGKILVGGDFLTVNGAKQAFLCRINPDGSRDSTFVVTGITLNSRVDRIQTVDEKIYLTLYGAPGFARLSLNGDLEQGYARYSGFSVDSLRRVLFGRQTDYLVWDRISRFNEDGTKDTHFSVRVGCCHNQGVNAVAIQRVDGVEKILIGGNFQSINDVNGIIDLARLNSDGSLDTNFQVYTSYPINVDIKVLDDGKFYVAGDNLLAKHLPNGAVDSAFEVSYGDAGDSVFGISVQSDGSVIMVGTVNRTPTAHPLLRRFYPDGTRDTNFSPVLSGLPSAIAIDSNDRILIGGAFTNVNCLRRTYLARLVPSGTPDIIDCIPPPPNPEPSLDVVRIRGARMVCCWPTNYPEYTLQATRRLRPKRPNLEKWVTVTNIPSITDSGSCVTNRIARYGRYYRLVKTN